MGEIQEGQVDCSDWTSTSGSGGIGEAWHTDHQWTTAGTNLCSEHRRLYCFIKESPDACPELPTECPASYDCSGTAGEGRGTCTIDGEGTGECVDTYRYDVCLEQPGTYCYYWIRGTCAMPWECTDSGEYVGCWHRFSGGYSYPNPQDWEPVPMGP